MSVFEIYGGRVDRRYLMKKSKDELATMYLHALDLLERRTKQEATAPAQDLSVAILALPLPTPSWARDHHGENEVYSAQDLRDLLKAAASLASSPADALGAGDRVDAELSKYLRHLPDCGSHVKEVDTYDENDMWSGTVKVSRPCTCGLAAILQSQKGDHG